MDKFLSLFSLVPGCQTGIQGAGIHGAGMQGARMRMIDLDQEKASRLSTRLPKRKPLL